MATVKELEAKLAELEAQNKALVEENERREALAKSEGMRAEQLRAVLNAGTGHEFKPYVESEKVPIRLFKDNYQYKSPLFVCINGRNVVIKRGVNVTVDKYIADFIDSMKSEQEAVNQLAEAEEQEFIALTDNINR